MIVIACFQQWRLWPAPSTNHYSMSFQETAIYIYILWLSLHVFSSGDYDLPPSTNHYGDNVVFKKQLCIYIYIMIIIAYIWPAPYHSLFNVVSYVYYIYYDYHCMFSAVATMTCPKYQSLFNVVSRNSYCIYMYIYIYIMIIYACFQLWRL